MIALLGVFLLVGCGTTVATTPTPTPSPTPFDVGRFYGAAIGELHDSALKHETAYSKTKSGSPEASAAARDLADDFKTLLVRLDAIPFPPNARENLSAFKKVVVARQLFWSKVSIDDKNYSAITNQGLSDEYNQAGIVLGHDVGVTLVLAQPSPTPST